MDNFDFFRSEGVWYKGNLHSYTTNSDGVFPPDKMAERYQKRGYDFVAVTDHNVVTDVNNLGNDDFLVNYQFLD